MKNLTTTLMLLTCVGFVSPAYGDNGNYATDLGIQTYTAQPESTRVVSPIGANETTATQHLEAYRESIDPNIHYINEEISVVRAFNKNKNEILEDVNWLFVEPKNVSEYACLYDEDKPKMGFLEFDEALPMYPYLAEGSFRPIRLVKISHKKNCQDYYVYMQQKINGQWVYKYNKYPFGIYKGNTAEFVTYLTEANIASVLQEEQARGKLTTRADDKEKVFVEFLESKDKKLMEVAYAQNFTLINDDPYATDPYPTQQQPSMQPSQRVQMTEMTTKPLANLITNTLERVLQKKDSSGGQEDATAMKQPIMHVSNVGKRQFSGDPLEDAKAQIDKLLIYDEAGTASAQIDLPAKENLTDAQIEELLSQLDAYKNYLKY